MNKAWQQKPLVAVSVCLVLLCVGWGAHPARGQGPAADLIVGISAIEPESELQVDGLRNVELWGYFYNASSRPVVLDWRTRRLRTVDEHRTAENSRDDYDGTLELHPNQLFLFHPTFYSREGRTRNYIFSIRDDSQRLHAVRTTPGETSVGPFSSLPEPIQRLLIDAFLDTPEQRWWWREY